MTPRDCGSTRGSAPRFDRALLSLAGQLAPARERGEWRRAWEAELWHRRHPRGDRGQDATAPWATADLATGLLRDALWLRAEGWNRLLRGTAGLVLLWLSALCVVAAGLGLALAGGSRALGDRLAGLSPGVALAAVLVGFVTFAVAPRRPVDQVPAGTTAVWLRRLGYFAAKVVLLLFSAFLLSTDVTEPVCAAHAATADFLQMLCFVLFALVGLRWALADQEQRCKHCLRLLAAPARVGRPSRNLLEWNGTELSCTRGHGRLTIPELETSWCERSAWVVRRPLEDAAVRT